MSVVRLRWKTSCLAGLALLVASPSWGQFQGLPPAERALVLGLGLGRASNSDFLRTIYALNTMEQSRIFRQQQQIRQQIAAQRARADQARIYSALQSSGRRPRYIPSPVVDQENRVSSDVLLCWEVFGATFLVTPPDETFRIDPTFKGGMRVGAIRQGGPADKAGWESGDVIVALHRYKVTSYDNIAYVAELPDLVEVSPIQVKYIRNSEVQTGKIDVLSGEPIPSAEPSTKTNLNDPRGGASLGTPQEPAGAKGVAATQVKETPASPLSPKEAELVWTRLGLRGRTVSVDRPGISFERGISVIGVRPSSPADLAGISPGEIVVGVAGYQTKELGDLVWVLENPEVFGNVPFVVVGSAEVRRGSLSLPAPSVSTLPAGPEEPVPTDTSPIESVPAPSE